MGKAWAKFVKMILCTFIFGKSFLKRMDDLADILTAYGIDVSAEEIRTTETETLKTTVREKVEVR